ncbi:hypothetical protein C3B61_09835 [Cryobacterium zongtaii]|uniref:Uncharacterized protein n=1 Tax=Cryobacterium zongtaii TaxID=1259217 RepID=A0A2S3ZG28_9MICO|nr:hypothetical protein C3B61_09835 [Cryobacterium zongtaii]
MVDVTVVGGGTYGLGTLPDGFTFLPAAVISGLTPDNGPEADRGDHRYWVHRAMSATIDGEEIPFTVVDDMAR